jgi:hypothetical protein
MLQLLRTCLTNSKTANSLLPFSLYADHISRESDRKSQNRCAFSFVGNKFVFVNFKKSDNPYVIFEMLDFEEKTLRNKSKVKGHK